MATTITSFEELLNDEQSAVQTTQIVDEVVDIAGDSVTQEESNTKTPPQQQTTQEVTFTTEPTYSYLVDRAKDLIKNGKWKDALIEVEGKEVAISELENISPELFFQIEDSQQELVSEEQKEKFVDKTALPQVATKLIELAQSGGDITEALQVYDTWIKPFEGIDLSDPRVQEQIVRDDLTRRGVLKSAIQPTIDVLKKELKLDEESNKVVEAIHNAFDKMLEQKENQAKEAQQKLLLDRKQFAKDIKEAFGTGTDATLANKLTKLATTYDKDNSTEVDKKYKEVMSDPKLAAELTLFLFDKDVYLKNISTVAKMEETKRVLDKLNLTKRNSTASSTKEKADNDNNFLASLEFKPIGNNNK